MHRFLILVLAIVAAVWPLGCERAPAAASPPAPVAATAPRTVVLSPALGLLMRDLGLQGTIVGRHGYDTYLPPSIPTCGDQSGIDFERLLMVKPTHVLTEWGSRELPPMLVETCREQGWVLQDFALVTLADARRGVLEMDRLLNPAPWPSAQAAALTSRMDAAWTKRDGIGTGRVLLVASLAPTAAFGPGSCHHEALVAVGARPAIEQGAGYIDVDFEDIANIKPDVFILLLPSNVAAGADHVHELSKELLATNLPPGMTASNTRIIDHPECQIPGVPMVRFADDLVIALREIANQK